MVKYTEAQHLDYIFHALSHEVRRKMLIHLKKGEQTAQDLAGPFSISLPAVSKHLKILERANLVHRVVQGRQHFFTVKPHEIGKAHSWVSEFEVFWNERLDNLEKFLNKKRN